MVGSREEIVAGGQRVRARKYPWGVVEGGVVWVTWWNTVETVLCPYS